VIFVFSHYFSVLFFSLHSLMQYYQKWKPCINLFRFFLYKLLKQLHLVNNLQKKNSHNNIIFLFYIIFLMHKKNLISF